MSIEYKVENCTCSLFAQLHALFDHEELRNESCPEHNSMAWRRWERKVQAEKNKIDKTVRAEPKKINWDESDEEYERSLDRDDDFASKDPDIESNDDSQGLL